MKNRDRKLYILIVGLYAILFIFVTYYHEPWFDESQAWNIARDGSYKDILFTITHGEGHPPLWSLILSIPAKLGVPYIWGIKIVSFIFAMLTICLFVFKSPFKNQIKALVPFTYFVFYQYAVISRTYVVMLLAFALISICFKNRNDKPWKFAGALFLLCETSLYGIVLAAGISIAWVIDIFMELRDEKKMTLWYKDKRFLPLLLLFCFSAVVVVTIFPYSNTVAVVESDYKTFFVKFMYVLFPFLGDSIISPVFPTVWKNIGIMDFTSGTIVTILIIVMIIAMTKRIEIKYFALPYLLLIPVFTFYSYEHHSGIPLMFVGCFIWMTYDSDAWCVLSKMNVTTEIKLKIRKICQWTVLTFLLFQIIYNFRAIVAEIEMPYSPHYEVAEYIKKHDMENAKIMVAFGNIGDESKSEADISNENKEVTYDVNFTWDAVGLSAFLGKNIFMNNNLLNGEVSYLTHFVSTGEENEIVYEKCRQKGIPEVLIGEPNIQDIYGDRVSMLDYTLVLSAKSYKMWKGGGFNKPLKVYVRNDCMDKYHVEMLKSI